MNIRVPQNASNFLSNLGPVSFPGLTLLHGVNCLVTSASIQHNYIPPKRLELSCGHYPEGNTFINELCVLTGRSCWQ